MYAVTSFINCNGCTYNPPNITNNSYNYGSHNNNYQSLLPIGLENNNSTELLVFQSPGQDEWTGKTNSTNRIPIDSINLHSAAARMRNSFDRKGTARQDYDITEAVQCYPQKCSNGRDKKPKQKAIACCQQYLKKVIMNHNYSKIVCFGDIAFNLVNNIINVNKAISPHLTTYRWFRQHIHLVECLILIWTIIIDYSNK